MIIEIIQTRLIKVSFLLFVKLLLKESNIRKCYGCGSELDIEDYFCENICDSCVKTQGYDKEVYDNPINNRLFERSLICKNV